MHNREYIFSLIRAGLKVIPCTASKQPKNIYLKDSELGNYPSEIITQEKGKAFITWKKYKLQEFYPLLDGRLNLSQSEYLGVATGSTSGNLEVIDIDTKNCPICLEHSNPKHKDGIRSRLASLLKQEVPEILDKLTIHQTRSGGIHLLYLCSVIEGSLKLAKTETGETLIETRGEGGQVIIPQSEGYTVLRGDLRRLQHITPAQRAKLLELCKSLSERPETAAKITQTNGVSRNKQPFAQLEPGQLHRIPETILNSFFSLPKIQYEYAPGKPGLQVFAMLNQIEPEDILREYGFKIVSRSAERVHFKRQGSTANTSGNIRNGITYIFSTSTELPAEIPLNSWQLIFYLSYFTGNYQDDKGRFSRDLALSYYNVGRGVKAW